MFSNDKRKSSSICDKLFWYRNDGHDRSKYMNLGDDKQLLRKQKAG